MCPEEDSIRALLFREGGPPARFLSPIVRMSVEQPRLGSTGSDPKGTRVDRSALHESVA
jgi:hypothetical protein